jgi:hypothetical protein
MIFRVSFATLSFFLSGVASAVYAADVVKKGESAKRVENARIVLAAVVKAAAENRRLPERGAKGEPFRRGGDDLTVYYIRAAAVAARRLPEKDAASAFLLALGIALDDSTLLRSNLVTGALWRKIEPDAARQRRLAVLGSPTLHGRHDLVQHFSVSAALTAALGAQAAESAGILKEMLDARGGSGFSFADLSADFAGIAFARRLLKKPARLADVDKGFRVGDYALSPRGLPEGLNAEQFEKQYGSLKDERFSRLCADLRKRLEELPGYRKDKAELRP